MNAKAPPPDDEEAREHDDESFLQWVALVVVRGCWLAEAYR